MTSFFHRLFGLGDSHQNSASQKADVRTGDNSKVEIHQDNRKYYINAHNEEISDAGRFIQRHVNSAIDSSLTSGSDNLAALIADDPEKHRLINQYRDLGNEGKLSSAISLLQGLADDGADLKPSVKLRLHLNLGLALERTGNRDEAVKELTEAARHCPQHPKSRAAKALALLFDNQNEAAYRQALSVLEGDGKEGLAGIALCYAASKLSEQELEEDALKECLDQESVRIAYLDYYARRKPEEWRKKAERALQDFPGAQSVKAEYALAVLPKNEEIADYLVGAKGKDDFETRIGEAAEALKQQALKNLGHDPPNAQLYEALVNNAVIALRLAGKESECLQLLERAIAASDRPGGYLIEQCAVTYVRQGKRQAAVDILASYPLDDRLKVMLYSLQAELGQGEESTKNLHTLLRNELTAEAKVNALRVLFEISINEQNKADAVFALEEMKAVTPDAPEMFICENIYSHQFPKFEEGDGQASVNQEHTPSKELIQLAQNPDELSYVELLNLANQFARAGEFRTSSDLLHERTSLCRSTDGLRAYLGATLDAGLYERAVHTLEALSPEVRNTAFALEIAAVSYFNAGEVGKSIKAFKALFDKNPANLRSAINYINVLIRDGREDLARRIITNIDEHTAEGDLPEKKTLAHLFMFAGQVGRAQRLSYELYVFNRDKLDAWQAVIGTILPMNDIAATDEKPDLEPTVVSEGCVVDLRMNNGQMRTYIVEPAPEFRARQDDAVSPDDAIAQILIGKDSGSTVLLPDGRYDAEGTIVSIKHKYIHAFQSIISRIEQRFGDRGGISSVSVSPEDKEHGFDNVIQFAKERHDYIRDRVGFYRKHPVPLSVLAKQIGSDPISIGTGLYIECEEKLFTCTGSLEQLDAAKKTLADFENRGCLLDPLAAWLVFKLNINHIIKDIFGEIYYSQSTLDLLRLRLREAQALYSTSIRGDGEGHAGTLGYARGRIQFRETTAETQKEVVESAQGFLDWIQEACKLTSSLPLDDMPEILRLLKDLDDGHINSDVFACYRSECLLISDDMRLRDIARETLGVQGCWLQAFLLYALENGKLSLEDYTRHVASLAQIGEDYISVNTDCLLEAFRLEESSEDNEWIAAGVLGCLGGAKADPRSHCQVAYSAILGVCKSVRPTTAELNKVSRILSAVISERPDASRIIEEFQNAFRERGPRALVEYIQGWRIGHFV